MHFIDVDTLADTFLSSRGEVGLSQNDQVGIDSVVSACPDIDSLQSCLRYFERTANELGVILAYKELGVRYREAARFNEAIGCHREGLRLAMQRKDTSRSYRP